jgi:hypothetical protein
MRNLTLNPNSQVEREQIKCTSTDEIDNQSLEQLYSQSFELFSDISNISQYVGIW